MEIPGPAAKGRADLDELKSIADRFLHRPIGLLTNEEESQVTERVERLVGTYLDADDPDFDAFRRGAVFLSARTEYDPYSQVLEHERTAQQQIDNYNQVVAKLPALSRCILKIEAQVSQLPERPPSVQERVNERNRVLVALYHLVNGQTSTFPVSLDKIATHAGVDEMTAKRAIREMPTFVIGHASHHYALSPNGRDHAELLELKTAQPEERVAPIRRIGLEGLHPDIVKASSDLFTDSYFQQAVFEAFKAIELRVRELSHLESFGKVLMGQAFGSDSPVINVATTAGLSGKNEQEGLALLFIGAMAGIRNPETHEPTSNASDAQSALEHLAFASLLMRRLDRAKVAERVSSPAPAKPPAPW